MTVSAWVPEQVKGSAARAFAFQNSAIPGTASLRITAAGRPVDPGFTSKTRLWHSRAEKISGTGIIHYFCSPEKTKGKNMLTIISQMAALFILILVGFGAAKLKMIDGRFSQQLSVFVINISSPCLIVSSVLGDITPDKSLILPVLAIGCVTYAFFVAVATLLSRILSRDKDMQGIYGFMLTFGNVGFIGYPIVASIFGQYAIFYASLLNIPFTILAFSLGKKMIQGGPGGLELNWKIFVSPAMIACYLSVLIVVLDIKWLPDLVVTPLTLLGNITVPAALLVIGTSMAQMDLRKIFSGKLIWGVSVLRLLVLPVVIFYLTRLIGFSGDILGINTVLAAMPVGTYGAMFCLQYGKDETVMVQGILISTLLSIISIPLITQIL